MNLQNCDSGIVFKFIPSIEDIIEYNGTDSYGCGITEVRDEILSLLGIIQEERSKCSSTEKMKEIPFLSHQTGRINNRGYFPEIIISIIVALQSPLITVTIYKFISKWIESRNGRKFRIKLPNGFEFESTQISASKFQKIVKSFYDNQNVNNLQDEAGRLSAISEEEELIETQKIHEAIINKRNQMLNNKDQAKE